MDRQYWYMPHDLQQRYMNALPQMKDELVKRFNIAVQLLEQQWVKLVVLKRIEVVLPDNFGEDTFNNGDEESWFMSKTNVHILGAYALKELYNEMGYKCTLKFVHDEHNVAERVHIFVEMPPAETQDTNQTSAVAVTATTTEPVIVIWKTEPGHTLPTVRYADDGYEGEHDLSR